MFFPSNGHSNGIKSCIHVIIKKIFFNKFIIPVSYTGRFKGIADVNPAGHFSNYSLGFFEKIIDLIYIFILLIASNEDEKNKISSHIQYLVTCKKLELIFRFFEMEVLLSDHCIAPRKHLRPPQYFFLLTHLTGY